MTKFRGAVHVTLPSTKDEAHRETLRFFVPKTFSVTPTEHGYALHDANPKLVGTASSWKQAQTLVPSGGIEKLQHVHGVRLPPEALRALATRGLYAWDMGIKWPLKS